MKSIIEERLTPSIKDKTGINAPLISIVYSIFGLFFCWAAFRIIFFEGLWGFDDLHYVRYAMQWDRLPADHWEARILFNSLLRSLFLLFGFSEFVLTLPALLASLVFMYCVLYVALHLWPISYAFFAAFLAAILPLDITTSTACGILPLANTFAALGTACVLTAKKRWQFLLSGGFIGLAVFTHLSFVFYAITLALVLWGYKRTELQWRKSSLLLGSAILVFIFVNFTSFFWLTGDPLFQFNLILDTGSGGRNMPRLLPSGNINPYWLIWPFQKLIISNRFGLIISISIILSLLSWKRKQPAFRFLFYIIILTWLFINYGTISPFKYDPLDHLILYWYPITLPVCLLATQVFFELRFKISRAVYLLAVIAFPLVLLSAIGPWGQNIEITKELMVYAKNQPDTKFVTDKYSLDEMFILNGARPPENVYSVKGFYQPGFFDIPVKDQQNPTDHDIVYLYNEQNMWRPFAVDYKDLVKDKVKLREISENKYRLISYCLPNFIRTNFSWLSRKQPAKAGMLSYSKKD